MRWPGNRFLRPRNRLELQAHPERRLAHEPCVPSQCASTSSRPFGRLASLTALVQPSPS